MQHTSYKLFVLFAGKDARLYVFRLGGLKRGLEERQLIRSKCDSRENKLEKTKGKTFMYKVLHTVQNKFAKCFLNFR